MPHKRRRKKYQNKILALLSKCAPIGSLTLLAILVHRAWFSWNLVTYGDWWYKTKSALVSLGAPTVISASQGIGATNIMLWRLPLDMLFGWMASLSLPFEVIDKVVLIPAALLPSLGGYLLFSAVSNSRSGAWVAALLMGFNTYILSINTQGHVLLPLAIGVSCTSLWAYVRYLNEGGHRYAVASIMLCALTGVVDVRILYLLVPLIGGITIVYSFAKKKAWIASLRRLTAVGSGVLLLHAYWLVPALGGGVLAEQSIFTRDLFGEQYWSIVHALALHHPFWSGTHTSWFEVQSISWWIWIVPIVWMVALYITRKNLKTLWWSLVALAGIFLAKQTDDPLGWVYSAFYTYVPGFSAFREATKFYYYIALGYAGVIALGIAHLHNHASTKKKKGIVVLAVLIVACVSLANTAPFIQGKMQSMFVKRTMPEGYGALNTYIEEQAEEGRILSIPQESKWMTFSEQHPKVRVEDVLHAGVVENSMEDKEAALAFMEHPEFMDTLVDMGIRYVVLPIEDHENEDNFFENYAPRTTYKEIIERTSGLERIDIGPYDVALYKVADIKPRVRMADKVVTTNAPRDESTRTFIKTHAGDASSIEYKKGREPLGTQIYNVFKNVSQKEIDLDAGTISASIPPAPASGYSLYVKQNQAEIFYTYDNQVLEIKKRKRIGLFQQQAGREEVEVLSRMSLGGPNHIIRVGEKTIEVQNGSHEIGEMTNLEEIAVYRVGANHLQDGGFEGGLWHKDVIDCNREDDRPDIAMEHIQRQGEQDGYSVRLIAKHHIACSSTRIGLSGDTEYLIKYDMRGTAQALGKIALEEEGGAEAKLSEHYIIPDTEKWTQGNIVIKTDTATSAAALFIESVPNKTGESVVDYDNIEVRQLERVGHVAIEESSVFAREGENVKTEKLVYQTAKGTMQNSIGNSTFREGLWTEDVEDCNNYDERPDIGMRREEAIDVTGQKRWALVLEAKRHSACTSPGTVAVEGGHNYVLLLSYQASANGVAGYNVEFNDRRHTTIRALLDQTKLGWQERVEHMVVPEGATHARVTLYAHETSGVKREYAHYTDIQFVSLPAIMDSYYVVAESNDKSIFTPRISLYEQSSTHYKGEISQLESEALIEIASQYQDGWKAYLVNEKGGRKKIEEHNHVRVDGWKNGWMITSEMCKKAQCKKEQDGTYSAGIIMSYEPQKLVGIGGAISIATLTGLIVSLAIRRKKNNGEKKKLKA